MKNTYSVRDINADLVQKMKEDSIYDACEKFAAIFEEETNIDVFSPRMAFIHVWSQSYNACVSFGIFKE